MNFLMKSNQVTQLDDNWRRPTLQKCKDAAFKIGLSDEDAEYYYDVYEGKNWFIDEKRGVRVWSVDHHMNKLKNDNYFRDRKEKKKVQQNSINLDEYEKTL